jgi:TolC family type I secretion outer membrane protein
MALIGTSARAEVRNTSLAELSKSCNFSKNLATDELDLADVIELAMCNNSQTRSSWLLAKSSQALYRRSLSSYWPTLDASAGYQRNLQEIYYKDKENFKSDEDAATLGASISWTLYDFGRRDSATEGTFQTMNSKSFAYNSTLQNVAFEAISSYYQTLSAIEALAAARANEEAATKAFELASKKFELGMNSKADKLQAETALVQAQLDTTRQEQVVRTDKANLLQILGLSPNLSISLATPLDMPENDPVKKSIGEIIEVALAKRPDLASKVSDMNASYADVRRASADFYPILSTYASGQWNVNMDEGNGKSFIESGSHAAGVKLTIPIFSGFDTTYSLRNAKYMYAYAREAVRLKEQEVELSVVNAYNDYKTSLKSLTLAKKMFESAQENEQVALGSYQAGKGDIISLLNAQSRLIQSRKEKIAAQYGVYIYRVALLRASGELSLKNLRDSEGPKADIKTDAYVMPVALETPAMDENAAATPTAKSDNVGSTSLEKPKAIWASEPILPERNDVE